MHFPISRHHLSGDQRTAISVSINRSHLIFSRKLVARLVIKVKFPLSGFADNCPIPQDFVIRNPVVIASGNQATSMP